MITEAGQPGADAHKTGGSDSVSAAGLGQRPDSDKVPCSLVRAPIRNLALHVSLPLPELCACPSLCRHLPLVVLSLSWSVCSLSPLVWSYSLFCPVFRRAMCPHVVSVRCVCPCSVPFRARTPACALPPHQIPCVPRLGKSFWAAANIPSRPQPTRAHAPSTCAAFDRKIRACPAHGSAAGPSASRSVAVANAKGS